MADRLVCRECHRVQDAANEEVCDACGSSSLTEDWAGYVVIAHPELRHRQRDGGHGAGELRAESPLNVTDVVLELPDALRSG